MPPQDRNFSRRPRLLLVGMGNMGRPYVLRAHRRGYAVTVVDNPGGLGSATEEGLFDDYDRLHEVRGSGDDLWFAAAAAAAEEDEVDGIVAFSESHVFAAALLADRLGLPGPSLVAATVSRNKSFQRAVFHRAGLAQPDAKLMTSVSAAVDWSRGRYPVVVKPLDAAGSCGVKVVSNHQELEDWVSSDIQGGHFLCEQFLNGPEFSCEVLVDDGTVVFENVTSKFTTDPPFCVELGHLVPARCSSAEREAIVETTRAATRAMGVRSAVAHVEVRLVDSVPHVIEVAVRTPGDHIMDIIRLATGVDLFDCVVAVMCGERPPTKPTRHESACVWYPQFEPDTVVPVEALRAAATLPGVSGLDLTVKPGEVAAPLRCSFDRVAGYVLNGRDAAELDENLSAVQSAVETALKEMTA
jgi:biotin carboxylase